MNVVFRADANKNIGMGHIMRCLSIADAFSAVGCQVEFFIADDTVSKLIQSRGYEAIILNSDYQKMEGEKWLTNQHPDLIIVDSYYVTAAYLSSLQEKMRSIGGKLIYLDDVYTFPYPADVVIDYNAYASLPSYMDLYRDSRVPMPQLILGSIYAPLRSMFRNIPKKVQNEKVHNILISTGGSDELHLSLSILKALHDHGGAGENSETTYHFLLGAMNTDKDEIHKLAANDDCIVLHENVSDMRSLISYCDLVISAAGSTMYEICACGVPFITFSTTDNQIPGAEAFERLGLGVNAGDLREPDTIDHNAVISGKLRYNAVELILAEIQKLDDDYEKRVLMGARMQELIDGFGADRMVQKIISFC